VCVPRRERRDWPRFHGAPGSAPRRRAAGGLQGVNSRCRGGVSRRPIVVLISSVAAARAISTSARLRPWQLLRCHDGVARNSPTWRLRLHANAQRGEAGWATQRDNSQAG